MAEQKRILIFVETIKNRTIMKIKKQNGKVASKQIHMYADIIIETAICSAWQLDYNYKINFLHNHECGLYQLYEILSFDEATLNHAVATHFACETWFNGWYGDLDIEEESLIKFFASWGCE